MHDERDDCENDEDVDKPSADMESEQTQSPTDQKNDPEGNQQVASLFGLSLF